MSAESAQETDVTSTEHTEHAGKNARKRAQRIQRSQPSQPPQPTSQQQPPQSQPQNARRAPMAPPVASSVLGSSAIPPIHTPSKEERRGQLRQRLHAKTAQATEQRNGTLAGRRLSKSDRREAAEKLKGEGLDDVEALMDQFGITDGDRRQAIRDAAQKRQTARVVELLRSSIPLPEGAQMRVRSEVRHVSELSADQRRRAKEAGLLKPGE